ncbi:MAG: CPBP family glutamic-type intramembrane protease [Snowella sp.]|nr:CPBP family glutamic-type intramembrane protease [Snowella sp.]
MNKKIRLGMIGFVILAAFMALFALLFTPKPPLVTQSDYAIARQLPANQLSYYPLQQSLDPQHYRAIADWVGRLILPKVEDYQKDNPKDWVWLEIYQAPPQYQNLIGKKVRLTWQPSPELDRYLKLVTTDINFDEAATESEKQGNVLPRRLDGRSHVGPLQALAGARTDDDVVIGFPTAQVSEADQATPILRVKQMPLMVTGRSVALVKMLGEAPPRSAQDLPAQCPGAAPCPSELMRVQHYNPNTQTFDGTEEIIRIPQQPRISGDRFISTPRQLAESPEGKDGWYIYGAQGKEGLFTVQALAPRSLLQLKPTDIVFGQNSGTDYINQGNWKNTPERKGTAQSVLVDPRSDSPEIALKSWQEGDRGLGIHLFGGIGGKKGESVSGGTVTGHFSFFFPQVVRDPFTKELQWRIPYYQVYAHNPQGILSGSQSFANYTGNLQRGWLNSRPISNVIIKSEILNDYDFGGIKLSPLTELQRQLEVMMARYRTGDGNGNASVTPAASCVQDSNQALYITIEVLKQQVADNPAIRDWLQTNPTDPQTKRFEKLIQLGDRLTQVLAPRGVIRTDWKNNAQTLAGTTADPNSRFMQKDTLANALLSWQSMLPRVSHDVLSQIFLDYGATLWFLRPNQVGGKMPEILPLAPTNLFGETPFISAALRRILASVILLPTAQEWGIAVALLGLYAAIAIPVGLKYQFLQWQPSQQPLWQWILPLIVLFFKPALWEELVFRVILLPYPDGSVSWPLKIGLALFSLGLFVIYHPINARFSYKAGNPLFFDPLFLSLAALLGLICTIAYFATGSLWAIALIHWVVVTVWLFGFNGRSKLSQNRVI